MGQKKRQAMQLETRMVPDPSMTDSEYLHQRRTRPNSPNVGRVQVMGNAMTRIGALCYIERASETQKSAAACFKSDYEALYGSGMPAVDAGRIQVDHSKMAHDTGMAARLDKWAKVQLAIQDLGMKDSNRVIAVVVLCIPVKDLLTKDHWRAKKQETDALLASLDEIAPLWGLATKEA